MTAMAVLDTPPPIGPRGLAIRCHAQGEAAYRDAAPLTACPYGPARPFSRRSWVAGYVMAAHRDGRRLPGDVELEAEVDDDAPWPGDAPDD